MLSRLDEDRALSLRPDGTKICSQGSIGLKAKPEGRGRGHMLRDRGQNFASRPNESVNHVSLVLCIAFCRVK